MNHKDGLDEVTQLLNKLKESEKSLSKIKEELDKERAINATTVQTAASYRNALIDIAEKMTSELNHEEAMLRQYEVLLRKYDGLNRKYEALHKSPLTRLIYLTWNLYNKIKYNRPMKNWRD